ncbi:collagen alpha-6(VI) chain [Bombina bombina]|uniref:collagen alpha-6(VI) chain n=1 Tax=Bombina bombina TaxID=8345 RepID=UPI00235A5824|nr:collagen alpha-6(VI) chain [Bombina bombina]
MKILCILFLTVNFLQYFVTQKTDVPEFADLVFMVDSSNSLEAKAFGQVKGFISRFISTLPIGNDKYQIGLAQYNDDLQVEFMPKTYKAKSPILNHIKNKFNFKGGSLKTGNALTKVHETFFKELIGRDKARYPAVLVVITAGTSLDDVRKPALALQKDGVKIIALGLQTAPESQLEAIASTSSFAFQKSNVRELTTFSNEMANAIKDVMMYTAPVDDVFIKICIGSSIADIVFLVDTSRNANAESVKDFLQRIISGLEINENCVNVGLVMFSNKTEIIAQLDEGNNKSMVANFIDQIFTMDEKIVNTGFALNFTRTTVFGNVTASRRSGGIQKIAVLVTHSSSTDSIVEASHLLHKENIQVFTVGVENANKTQLKQMASHPYSKYSVDVKTFVTLSSHADTVLKKLLNRIDDAVLTSAEKTDLLKKGCLNTEEADIYLVIDGSGSIQYQDFQDMKNFLSELIDMFDIGPQKVRVAAVQYSSTTQLEFGITTQYDKNNLKLALKNMRQLGGGTSTGAALNFTQELVVHPQNVRAGNVPVHLIVLTDGESQDSVKEASHLLRGLNINMYAIGVQAANKSQLLEIAGSNEKVFFVYDFSSLIDIKNNIARQICQSEACKQMEADIMFLVDSSGSIGMENFNKMKAFMKELVNKTEVGRDKVQFGAVQFSDDSKAEFQLDTHTTKSGIWNAIENMGYFGQTTYTGNALKFVSDYFTQPKGARPKVRKFLILITDGQAHDEVKTPAESLRNSGVTIYSVGIFNANKSQLFEISGRPEQVFYIESFDTLKTIEDELIFGVCSPYEDCSKIEVADIVFVIDSSGSIDPTEYGIMKDFIISLVNKSDVGPNKVQFGALKYADDPTGLFYLNEHESRQSIIQAIEKDDKVVKGINTYTAEALDFSKTFFRGEHGSRQSSGVPQILIVLTDGESHDRDSLNQKSKELQDLGIIIYAIGIDKAQTEELITMAGSKGQWFLVDNFNGLKDIFVNISEAMCNSTVCDVQEADLVFLIDGSSSISSDNFNELKTFMISVVDDFDVGPNKVHVGVAQYSDVYKLQFNLKTYVDKVSIKKQIDNIKQITGNTLIGSALQLTENMFSPSANSRINDGVPQILLVITDGDSQDKVGQPALNLRNKGIDVHAIGVGQIDHTQLLEIAGTSEKKYTVENFGQLKSIKKRLVRNTCTDPHDSDCFIDVVVGFDISVESKDASLFHRQTHLENILPDILQKMTALRSASCSKGNRPQISLAFHIPNAKEPFSPIFRIYSPDLVKSLKSINVTGPSFLTSPFLQSMGSTFQNKNTIKAKMLLVFTDGLDEDLEKLEQTADDLQNKGLNALVTVALEGSTNIHDIKFIEFGRGFDYMDQMNIGMPDIGTRLAKQMSRVAEKTCCCILCKCTGEAGMPGPYGIGGQKGRPGMKGQQGHSGEEGETGERGEKGQTGVPGTKGCQGVKGPKGSRGVTGDKNEDGESGINGIPGEQGHPGLPGIKGEEGESGEAGSPGPRGPSGERGSTGLRGDPGSPGVDNNIPGSMGVKGDPGIEGEQGAQGPPGTPGARGGGRIQGKRGLPGPQGIKGDPGDVGHPGEEGLRGLQGENGITGKKGDKGSNGPKGVPGTFGVAGGIGDHGNSGRRGKKGVHGDPGEKGIPGPLGQRGDEGKDGTTGYGTPGKKGSKGQIGFRGDSGIKGISGDPGVVGDIGPKGLSGLSVSSGYPGDAGNRGGPGPQGRRGNKGTKGQTAFSTCDLINYVRDRCPCSEGRSTCPAYPTELLIALDMSNDITPAIYKRMINIVTDILANTTIRGNNCPVGARVAVVSYSSHVKYHIRFSDFQSKDKLITAVKNIPLEKTSRGRDIGGGMRYVARNIFKRSLNGATVRKIALFFTNGRSEDVVSINTAVLEYSALGIIPAVIAFTSVPVIKRAFTMDPTGTFQLIEISANVDYKPSLQTLQLCTLCFDGCKPDTLCVQNKANLQRSYMDIMFVLDSSYNVKRDEFDAAKNVIRSVIDQIDISSEPKTSNTGDRVALVSNSLPSFAPSSELKPNIEFDLTAYTSKAQMKRHIQENVHQLNGQPSLGFTLKWTIDNMMSKAPNLRKNKVIITILSGETSQWDKQTLRETSLKVKCKGYAIFVLSIGKSYNYTELEEFVSLPLEHHLLQLGRIHKPDHGYIVGFMQPFLNSIRRAINKYPATEMKSKCSKLTSVDESRSRRQSLSQHETGEPIWSEAEFDHQRKQHSKDTSSDLNSFGAFTAHPLATTISRENTQG